VGAHPVEDVPVEGGDVAAAVLDEVQQPGEADGEQDGQDDADEDVPCDDLRGRLRIVRPACRLPGFMDDIAHSRVYTRSTPSAERGCLRAC